MIRNRLNLMTFESKMFAIKCAKRGNDVYLHKVYRLFNDSALLAEETVF
jgi:hypothetical protein